MSTLKKIEHFAVLAGNSRGMKREEAIREMKLAFLEFLKEEREKAKNQLAKTAACNPIKTRV